MDDSIKSLYRLTRLLDGQEIKIPPDFTSWITLKPEMVLTLIVRRKTITHYLYALEYRGMVVGVNYLRPKFPEMTEDNFAVVRQTFYSGPIRLSGGAPFEESYLHSFEQTYELTENQFKNVLVMNSF